MADYLFLLESRLSPDQQTAVRLLRKICREASINLYLTGGPMRDLLTGSPVRYLDFTVEGNPLTLEKGLAANGAAWLNADREDRVVRFRLRGQRARVRAARAGAPPGAAAGKASAFRSGTIDEDLRTRGLTLNSIGLSLAEASHGLLRDPTNGQADIEARLIRMNYPYVFYDDPAVLLRALRLQARLQFAIEERTQARMDSARESHYLEHAVPGSLGQELEAIAYEPDPSQVLRALDQAGLLEDAYRVTLRQAKMDLPALAQLARENEGWEQLGVSADTGLVALPLMLGNLGAAEQARLGRLLQNAALTEQWRKIPAAAQAFERKLADKKIASLEATANLIEKTQPEAVLYAALAPEDKRVTRKLRDFQERALPLRQRLPLRYLPQVGLAVHSPEAQRILDVLYKRLLRGELTQDGELVAALHELTGPPPAPAPPARGRRAGAGVKGAAVQFPPPSAAAVRKPAAPPAAAAPNAATAPAAPAAKVPPAKPAATAPAAPAVKAVPAKPPAAAPPAKADPAKPVAAPPARPASAQLASAKGKGKVKTKTKAHHRAPKAARPAAKAAAKKPAAKASAKKNRKKR